MAINGTLGSNINKDLRTATQFRHGAWRVLTVSLWKKKPMGAALGFLGQKLFASSTLISARFENISCASGAQCCTSVAAVQSPIIRRTGGFFSLLDLCRTDSPLLSTKQPEKKVASPTRVMSPRT